MSIGILASSLQPVPGQSTAAELSQIDTGDSRLVRWIADQDRLGPVGWMAIWRRFHGMGECAEQFLGSGLLAENDRRRRLVLTGAYLAATSRHDKILLHRRIAGRQHPDRIMAMFALALGPRQIGDGEVLVGWLRKAKSPLERIAACLALTRFESFAKLPDAVVGKAGDHGVLAAGLYCRPALPEAWIQTRLARGADDHAHLVWRAYLLGAKSSSMAEPDRRQVALRILRRGERSALPEAAYYLAHDGGIELQDADIQQQSLAIKLQLAASPALRQRLLGAVDPELRAEPDILLRRWWSLFTRFAATKAVESALDRWRSSPAFQDLALRRSIGLALAWRLFASPADVTRKSDADISQLIDTPAGAWLQLALGQERTAAVAHTGFADLAIAYPLAADARLARGRIADLLESALWREGGHPGRSAIELHRQLQAELMIDGRGATSGGFAQLRGAPTYEAKGVSRGDNLFLVANQLFRFIRAEEPWSMREHRLVK